MEKKANDGNNECEARSDGLDREYEASANISRGTVEVEMKVRLENEGGDLGFSSGGKRGSEQGGEKGREKQQRKASSRAGLVAIFSTSLVFLPRRLIFQFSHTHFPILREA